MRPIDESPWRSFVGAMPTIEASQAPCGTWIASRDGCAIAVEVDCVIADAAWSGRGRSSGAPLRGRVAFEGCAAAGECEWTEEWTATR